MSTEDFRDFITTALRDRQERYPGYSMRAFAKEIDTSPQKLNAVLRHGAGLSPNAAAMIAAKLQLNDADKDYFCALVCANHERSQVNRVRARRRLQELQAQRKLDELSLEDFRSIAEWHCMACYLLVDLHDFNPDPAWAAKRVGITPEQAQQNFDKLFTLGLIRVEGEKWIRDSARFNISAYRSSEEMQNYHRQIIEKSLTAAEAAYDTRHLTSTVISVTQDDIEFAKAEIEKFRKQLVSQIAERGGSSERVYALSMNLFPLDKPESSL